MTRTLRVTVPAAQVTTVRATLLILYQVKADALNVATAEYLDDRESLASVLGHRRELGELDDLIEQAGWEAPSTSDSLELVGPADLVRDAVYGALLGATSTVEQACRRYEAGDIDLVVFGGRVDELVALFRVFEALEEADGAGL